MKYKNAEFLLLSSNQQDCGLRILTEAGITPSLGPHIGLYFKHATGSTHGDQLLSHDSVCQGIYFPHGYECVQTHSVPKSKRHNVYKKQNYSISHFTA